MNTAAIIPARFASTRFPGKPLALINGVSMIQRVYDQACSSGLDYVAVATDDSRIYDHVKSFGGEVIMIPSRISLLTYKGMNRLFYPNKLT